ncbi:MAG: adenine deaminase [Flavobacteriales bacterium]|nr:adenine deaminase [Flavobacteriales bacterium]
MSTVIEGQIVDLFNREIFPGQLIIEGDRISQINRTEKSPNRYILPGFIDAHIHIESSMLVPSEFAKEALKHGTVGTISDPHEIANVLGVAGVHYMIENAKGSPLKFHFGVPSCVPATSFETAGAVINSEDVKTLLESDDIYYLAEMMNYPGVLHGDPEVLKKIQYAKEIGKPIDGHAPGLRGEAAAQYIAAGISTDHECFSLEEALDKLANGMKIIIREGSAAKNFEALHPLFDSHPEMLMFCSDDKHPDDLLVGHINELVKRSVALGYDLFNILTAACKNPVDHYKMDVGLLKVGDKADFIVCKDLNTFEVDETYIDGVCVMQNGISEVRDLDIEVVNNFNSLPKKEDDFWLRPIDEFPLIEALDGQLITEKKLVKPSILDGNIVSNIEKDHLKISVVNRYNDSPVSSGLIQHFGLKNGAIASTVAHDSHNIVAVGTSDELLMKAVNKLIESKGGLSAVSGDVEMHLPLEIAGLMSQNDAQYVGQKYQEIDAFVKSMGCKLHAPFMTLSFMALLVIPKIKMSDLGVFDAEKFEFLIKV